MRRRIPALLVALLLCTTGPWAAAEAPTQTPAPVPTARPYGEPMSGTIRMMLQSLGERQALGMTIEGVYTVDGDRGFQFASGTEIALGLDGASIVLKVGGAAIDMGTGFTLVRHLDDAGGAGGIYIHESELDKIYTGDLNITAQNGSLRVIMTLGIEEYLYGVVPHEMSDEFPLEALKAQAVAARTYAMERKSRKADEAYDVVDTANDQVYKGMDARYLRTIQAVNETRGMVGMYKGRYAECFYAASNGGQTALPTDVWGNPGDYGYVDMRDDPYDLENPESRSRSAVVARDVTQLPDALYAALVNKLGEQLHAAGEIEAGEAVGVGEIVNVEAVEPVYGGGSRQYGTIRFTVKATVRRFTQAQEGTVRMLGDMQVLESPQVIDMSFYDEVRGLLGIALNSSRYELVTVETQEDGFRLTSRRYGHGVGMSQRGAQWMASAHGKTFMDILSFYYPGMEVVQMQWIIPALTAAQALPKSLGYAAPRPTPAPTPAPLPALAQGEYYARVSVSGVDGTLNVRAEPSREADLIGIIRNEARIIVEAETEDGWAKMKTAELEGYVSMEFIEKE